MGSGLCLLALGFLCLVPHGLEGLYPRSLAGVMAFDLVLDRRLKLMPLSAIREIMDLWCGMDNFEDSMWVQVDDEVLRTFAKSMWSWLRSLFSQQACCEILLGAIPDFLSPARVSHNLVIHSALCVLGRPACKYPHAFGIDGEDCDIDDMICIAGPAQSQPPSHDATDEISAPVAVHREILSG